MSVAMGARRGLGSPGGGVTVVGSPLMSAGNQILKFSGKFSETLSHLSSPYPEIS